MVFLSHLDVNLQYNVPTKQSAKKMENSTRANERKKMVHKSFSIKWINIFCALMRTELWQWQRKALLFNENEMKYLENGIVS